MAKKLYVGNLDWGVSDDELKDKFSEFGTVEEAVVVKDKATGRSRGFGFVTFTEDDGAQGAIDALNGQDFKGRSLTVNEARPPRQSRDY